MTLAGLLECRDDSLARVVRLVKDEQTREPFVRSPVACHALIAAHISKSSEAPLLVVTATGRAADETAAILREFLPASNVAAFPSWETLPHERLSPSADTVGRRTMVLRQLVHPDPSDPCLPPVDVIVASIRAVIQPIAWEVAQSAPVRLRVQETADFGGVIARLVDLGFERVDLVERRGQFAVRGGILDVFPATEEHAVRVEFFGDQVDSVRYFTVTDQRSVGKCQHGLLATSVREMPTLERFRSVAELGAVSSAPLRELVDRLAAGDLFEGMESLNPIVSERMVTLIDLLADKSSVVISEPERVRSRNQDVLDTAEEFKKAGWLAAALGSHSPIDLDVAGFHNLDELHEKAVGRGMAWWSVSPFDEDEIDVRVEAGPVEAFNGSAERITDGIRAWVRDDWAVIVTARGQGPLERLSEELSNQGIASTYAESLADLPVGGTVTLVRSSLPRGFTLPSARVVCISEHDLFGRRTKRESTVRMPSRRRKSIDPLELKPGDYVVHEQHGVGRYVEMMHRTVQGADREYLIIEYAPSKRGQPADRLFVPMDQLDVITKYVGGDAPTLHRLGGSDWATTKSKARRAVRQIAQELVQLYAARQASKGYAFADDTPWQRELEDAFAYDETPDQLACVEDVKSDMQKPIPMDRLICGDVGYGKTEIAVRAAFKAVQDGKQVAILVPTTLLVQQHFATFTERYGSFPVRVEALSRFTSAKNYREVVQGITDGTVDIVIGTHRLLTPEIRFRDLGLVVVDEEQRFGVEHKEHLKALRANVDVLAMSATPIPRTLEMAVTGIREMSVIQTPPEERHPVLTYVGPHDDATISAAIHRELLREGQVFFLHNRVASIERAAKRLSELVPDARIAVAHGQMPESRLERVIVDFWNGDIDVLVCTTIVESGIDIPNANTLIVDRADTFGLSQLHQLRGRVGRGRERAYAYMMYEPEQTLTETAHERLSTIAQRTELGSGMQIAMKDLEIRGAGNLLGGEQSGHIADVGFDLYVRLVGEALAEHQAGTSDTPSEVGEVKVELAVTAHIPPTYIGSERLRLEIYKRLADAHTLDEVMEIESELLDRYGQMPPETESLVEVARLRVNCRNAGVHEVITQGNKVRISPVDLPESASMRVTRLYPGTVTKSAIRTIIVPLPTSGTEFGAALLRDRELVSWADELITALAGPAKA